MIKRSLTVREDTIGIKLEVVSINGDGYWLLSNSGG